MIEQRLPSGSVSPLKAKRGDILAGLVSQDSDSLFCSEHVEVSLRVGFLAVLARGFIGDRGMQYLWDRTGRVG